MLDELNELEMTELDTIELDKLDLIELDAKEELDGTDELDTGQAAPPITP